MQLQLIWWRCGTPQHWCAFESMRLTNARIRGVYVIWYADNPSKVVMVGKGVVAECLAAHRQDPKVMIYSKNSLRVSWAAVDESSMGGVESYLASMLNPLIGLHAPTVAPIEVNLPWADSVFPTPSFVDTKIGVHE